ncbi:hypothetical protein GOP47_0027114 [Adiantum capillus-veneris]|nr:hypothetical protein GOP47_0027114 [Adiantum capillus-veneris]
MDSSSEEEDEQFFETLEDIASSSDADSGSEKRYHSNASQHVANASSAPFSKYDVWKNSPGSILERRQRLFMQMGLKVEEEDSENSVVLVVTAPTGSLPAPSSFNPNSEHRNHNSMNADQRDDGVSRSPTSYPPSASASDGRTMIRSRSDGTFSRLQSSETVEGHSLRLVRSGTASPLSNHGAQKRLGDVSGAVTRTGSGSAHPPTKPPLGGKRINGKIIRSSADQSVARKLQFQWSKFGRFRVTGKNGNSLFHSDAKASGDTRAPRMPLGNSGEFANSKDTEVLCRIKDLDSGKEFVVNEVGKDGMWNKLKELDTGREITLEEFESTLGLSPIVQEVMRRERAAGDSSGVSIPMDAGTESQKRKKGWFKAFKGVVRASREKGSSLQHGSGSDKEASTEKSSRKSGSATDDSQDTPLAARPVKVRVHKKSVKEFGDLRLRQEIQAHQGAIWTMKFSLDGCYLATAGQDKVVKVWEVFVHNSRSSGSPMSSGELNIIPDMSPDSGIVQRHSESKRSNKSLSGRKDVTSQLPSLFMLSENAKCTFVGHNEDILDLSWSPSQSLLSSSMDKTVRLWNISSKSCLKIFTHNDYVTCIQFHPLDPGHFISGSLDGKVRIWCIQEPQVIDWVDLQEMVTAACYTPNGQGAVVGSYKGTCRFYKTPGNKLQLDTTFEVRDPKTKRSQGKKITGFQFVPGDKMKILITSNDSRIRVYNGTEIGSKFKGFRNSKSHISASFSRNGRFIVSASEDSRVCIWSFNDSSYDYPDVQRTNSGAYEDFSVKHVLVAVPWPGPSSRPIHVISGDSHIGESAATHVTTNMSSSKERSLSDGAEFDNMSSTGAIERPAGLINLISSLSDLQDVEFSEVVTRPTTPLRFDSTSKPPRLDAYRDSCCGSSLLSNCVSAQHIGSNGFFSDCKGSATWPEEKLLSLKQNPPTHGQHKDAAPVEHANLASMASAWGLVIVTGGSGGEIRVFQNYSLPVRL